MKREFDKKSGVLTITLDRHERGNSLGSEEAREFKAALGVKGVRALLLRADSKRWFCTGGNLLEQGLLKEKKKSLGVQLAIRSVLTQIEKAPFPTAVALTGDVFGGGVELISSFDFVVVAPHVFLGLWQRRIGVVFGWGGGERLLQRLGPKKLRNLSLEGRVISSYEAHHQGLVDRVVPEHAVTESADQWLRTQLRLPEVSFSPLKEWTPTKSASLFSRLWMNPVHRTNLKSRR